MRFDRRIGLLLAGVVLLAFVGVAAAIALPATDASLVAKPKAMTALERHGMAVYQSEGCWYCHTQDVRSTSTDHGLGPVTSARAFAGLSPAMLGEERVGPDLTNVGTRMSSAQLVAYLNAHGNRGSMPSYAFLSKDDLRALAAYLLALR